MFYILIHFKETSLIVELFSEHHGRIPVVAKGARRPRSILRGMLQAFQPLQATWSGNGDIKTLHNIEWSAKYLAIDGDALICGFYLNELIFSAYWNFIKKMDQKSSSEKEYSLRIFENQLLQELGYGLDFNDDIEGNPIKINGLYDFIEDQGFSAQTEGKILGEILLNIVNPNQVTPNSEGLNTLKKLNRKRLKSLLGDKPLKSKELFFVN